MGVAKLEEFTAIDNRIARFAKALGHPARVAILRVLMQRRTCICGDIVNELPLSQSTVSQHLKELKEAGLIKGDIEGKTVCYCIDPCQWALVQKHLTTFLDEFVPPTAECCTPMNTTKK